MMKNQQIDALLNAIAQKVNALKNSLQHCCEEKIFIPTHRTLFRENYQMVGEYLDEIEQTLARLRCIQPNEVHYVQLMTERLIKQCALLSDATTQYTAGRMSHQAENIDILPKSQHPVHRLPPRERLEKYYDALNQLNERYQQTLAFSINAEQAEDKKRYFMQSEVYKVRKQKCQEAIDLLEEYLAFKDEQHKA